MIHYFYIIYSEKLDRYYIGETFDLGKRLGQHRADGYEGAFTKAASDWCYVVTRECESKNEALFLERFVKRMKSKKFVQKVIADHGILDDLLKRM